MHPPRLWTCRPGHHACAGVAESDGAMAAGKTCHGCPTLEFAWQEHGALTTGKMVTGKAVTPG
eukprot:349682-Chlamydomonas_euryale.AAC.15